MATWKSNTSKHPRLFETEVASRRLSVKWNTLYHCWSTTLEGIYFNKLTSAESINQANLAKVEAVNMAKSFSLELFADLDTLS